MARANSDATVGVAGQGDALAGDGLSVLLVEHRGADVRLIVRALEEYPQQRFETVVAPSLMSALHMLAADSPDAVLLDADLPDDGGLAAIEEIRAAAPTLPLIVLSGDASGDTGLLAMEAGAQDYFVKGELDNTALGRVVLQALARQRLRLELADKLRDAENRHIRLRNIVDLNLDAVLVVARHGDILFANRAASELLGETGGARVAAHLEAEGPDQNGRPLWLTCGDGTNRRLQLHAHGMRWEEQEAWLVLVRECPAHHTPPRDVRPPRADRDPVTGLLDRSAFYRQGREILRRVGGQGMSAAVICLNLERFRHINQALGHRAGDAVLSWVATRLKRQLRAGDLLASFGRDEFLLLLPSLRRGGDAKLVAGKLLETVAMPVSHGEQEVHINARAGISLFPRDSTDIVDLAGQAQIAAERAKQRPSRRVATYTPDLASQSARRFRLEQGLQKALARDQFRLLYQPIVDIPTGRVVAAEALLRWQPEPGEVISAGEFIPILEETGLIDAVGEWVLHTACHNAYAWREAGQDIPVSVNLSPLQFGNERLPSVIADALADSGLSARQLWLEITESALMQPLEVSIDMLWKLRDQGTSVCIDDFGTGFSSLAYLKQFPIDTLKIDRSFIRDLTHGPKDAAITRNTIQLGHALGLKVVAEGVETEDQRRQLLRDDCDFYQGYMFSPPLPAPRLLALAGRDHFGKSLL